MGSSAGLYLWKRTPYRGPHVPACIRRSSARRALTAPILLRSPQWLRERAIGWIARLDRDVLVQLGPEPTRLGEALTALAAAAVVLRARIVAQVPPWTVIGQITRGRLVAPAAPG